MKCSNCETDNPDQARFCMKCGSSLVNSCPECKIELPQEAVFCFGCGHNLERTPETEEKDQLAQYIPRQLLEKIKSASKSGIQNERRVVTMLFCDLQGSTAAAEKLDPEDWAEIMNGAFKYLIPPVYEYEGVLARLMGDAILAFFGAPIAHEDDPERAVLTALSILNDLRQYCIEIKQKWDLEIDIRIGINTGLVVVGEMGTDMRVEYTAMGDAINLASRMESTALAGTIQISHSTYKLVAPLFDVLDLGELEIKGKSKAIPTYRILGRKSKRGQLRGIMGLESDLVGRDSELQLLNNDILKLIQGFGKITSITGEAGLGKSRILAELYDKLKTENILHHDPFTTVEDEHGILCWFQGASLSYQASTPYAIFVDLFNTFFRLDDKMSDLTKYEIIKGRLSKVPRCELLIPFIATLMNITPQGEDFDKIKYLDPPLLREKIIDSTIEFFEIISQIHPVLLVFDDVHWSDESSINLIKELFKLTERTTVMILVLFRPKTEDSSWKLHELAVKEYSHLYQRIHLGPLDSTSSMALVFNLLQIEGLSDETRDLIIEKAEGNPFFIEEIIRSLIDSEHIERHNEFWRTVKETKDIAIPDTLTGVLTSRLDKLDDESKHVLQTAAVIGREFNVDVLLDIYEYSDLIEDSLLVLEKRGLIQEKSKKPKRIYYFKHGLTREAAYNSLLIKSRRELHSKIAECYLSGDPSRVHEIARHFYESTDYQKAIPFLIQSAEAALRSYSHSEALEAFNKVKIHATQDTNDDIIKRLYEGLGAVLTLIGNIPDAMSTYEAMIEVGRSKGNHEIEISGLNKLGFCKSLVRGPEGGARSDLEFAETLGKQKNYLEGLAETYMKMCFFDTAIAEFESAERHLSEAAEIGESLQDETSLLFGKTHRTSTLLYMTKYEESWAQAMETKKIAEEFGNKEYLSELNGYSIPLITMRNGDLEGARAIAEGALKMAIEIGSLNSQFLSLFTLSSVETMLGNYENGLKYLKELRNIALAMQNPGFIAVSINAIANFYGTTGLEDQERIDKYFEEALAMMDAPYGSIMGAVIWSDYGFHLIGKGEFSQSREFFTRAMTEPTAPIYLFKPYALMGQATSYMMEGDLLNAKNTMVETMEYVTERKMTHFLPYVYMTNAFIAQSEGNLEESMNLFVKANEIATQSGMKPVIWQTDIEIAKLLKQSGEDEKMNQHVSNALKQIDYIMNGIKDEKMKENLYRQLSPKLIV